MCNPNKLFLLATLVVTVTTGAVYGAETRDPAQNAALQYWMATSLTPRISDEDNKTLFTEKPGEKLSEASRRYAGMTSSMPFVVRASKMPYCEWGLQRDGGPDLLMPHLSKMRFLGKMISSSLQLCVEDGKAGDGVPYIRGGLALGRFMGQDDWLISYLVGQAIQELTIQKTAIFLPQLDKAALHELQIQLEQLPAQRPISEVLLAEGKMFRNWMRKRIAAGSNLVEELRALGATNDQLGNLTAEQFKNEVDSLEKFYQEAGAAINLPDSESRQELAKLEVKVRNEGGPLCKLLIPTLLPMRDTEQRTQIHFLQLRAAIRVLLDGPEALANCPDPVDGKPFTYSKTPTGFELNSRAMDREKNVKLAIGFAWKSTPLETKVEPAPKKPVPPPADF